MIDLHTHSTASDGSLTPTELVQLAAASGLSWLALTDHNTAAGLPEFLQAIQGTGIQPVCGAEITCELAGEELHILALDLPKRSFGQLDAVMAEARRRSEASKRDLVDNLRKGGYQISYAQIEAAHPHSIINRAHIAQALQEAGYVPSIKAAFADLLGEEAGYYHPARRLQAQEAIGIIRELGALPVWAHPFLRLTEAEVADVLAQLVPAGLVGMETAYSTYTPAQTRAAADLAARFGLRSSGGSDFHGLPKPDIQLGVGRGDLCIPDAVAEQLLGK